MILITLKDIFFQYDAYHLTKAFYPNEIIKTEIKPDLQEDKGLALEFFLNENREFVILDVQVGKVPSKEEGVSRKSCKYRCNRALYDSLKKLSGKSLDWGMLIGVRPTKMATKKWKTYEDKILGEEETRKWMVDYYGVSEEKANLAMDIAMWEDKLIQGLDLEEGFSLYVGIPFCKTRCSYCSFTAYPLAKWEHRIDEYLDALCKEIVYVGETSRSHGARIKKLNTIYIGGGTPTSLTAKQLDRLLTCIEESFSYEHLREVTVEAGRPDSITREKLEVMKNHKIGRISINPQTMQEKTLRLIGREH